VLKVGNRAIVRDINRNNVHPPGTRVKVLAVLHSDKRPYYCQNDEGGSTAYSYAEDEVIKVDESETEICH